MSFELAGKPLFRIEQTTTTKKKKAVHVPLRNVQLPELQFAIQKTWLRFSWNSSYPSVTAAHMIPPSPPGCHLRVEKNSTRFRIHLEFLVNIDACACVCMCVFGGVISIMTKAWPKYSFMSSWDQNGTDLRKSCRRLLETILCHFFLFLFFASEGTITLEECISKIFGKTLKSSALHSILRFFKKLGCLEECLFFNSGVFGRWHLYRCLWCCYFWESSLQA